MIGIDMGIWRPRRGPILGPELVTNGDFANGSTGWALGTGWAVTAGQLVATAAAANTSTSTSAGVVVAGKQYQIMAQCVSLTAGGWKVLLEGGANVFGDQTGPGAFANVITAAVSGSLYIWANSTLSAAFDNVSVRELIP